MLHAQIRKLSLLNLNDYKVKQALINPQGQFKLRAVRL